MRKKEVKKDNNCLVDLPSNHSFYGIDLMKFICAIMTLIRTVIVAAMSMMSLFRIMVLGPLQASVSG